MCQRGDESAVLQGHRVEAFALAAHVNPNNCPSYLIHREASAHRLPRRIHPYLTALVPLQQWPLYLPPSAYVMVPWAVGLPLLFFSPMYSMWLRLGHLLIFC